MERKQALEAIKDYHYSITDIPKAEWLYMEENLIRFKVFTPGEYLCKQGEKTNTIAYLADGFFESIYLDGQDAKSIIQKFYLPNTSMAPYNSILENVPSDVSIVALEKSSTFLMNYQNIKKLYTRHECWQTIGRRFGEMEYISKNKREKELLTKNPEERYEIFLRDNIKITEKITDRKLAQYLGISYVSLSRIKKRILTKS